MRHLRMTVSPSPEMAPRPFEVLAGPAHLDVARAVAMNVLGREAATGLFHVEGDVEAARAALVETAPVALVETAPAPGSGGYLLVGLDPSAVPMLATAFETMASERLVVLPPAVYREGTVTARLVGPTDAVADVVDALPAAVDVEVHAVGERGLAHEPTAAALSDRQREALLAALELGYYDQPRAATHADVAERLGCAESTASEHLQKAEAKLVRAAMR